MVGSRVANCKAHPQDAPVPGRSPGGSNGQLPRLARNEDRTGRRRPTRRSSIGTGWAAGCWAALCRAFPTNRVGAPSYRSRRDVSGTKGHRLAAGLVDSNWRRHQVHGPTREMSNLWPGQVTEILDERLGPAPSHAGPLAARIGGAPGAVDVAAYKVDGVNTRDRPLLCSNSAALASERRQASVGLLRGRVARSEGSGTAVATGVALFAHAGVMPGPRRPHTGRPSTAKPRPPCHR